MPNGCRSDPCLVQSQGDVTGQILAGDGFQAQINPLECELRAAAIVVCRSRDSQSLAVKTACQGYGVSLFGHQAVECEFAYWAVIWPLTRRFAFLILWPRHNRMEPGTNNA